MWFPCCKNRNVPKYHPQNDFPVGKVIRITAFVVLLLSLVCFAISHILKGVSLLPYKYTQGLEHVYGLSSICFRRLTAIFGIISIAMGAVGLAALAPCFRNPSFQKYIVGAQEVRHPTHLITD